MFVQLFRECLFLTFLLFYDQANERITVSHACGSLVPGALIGVLGGAGRTQL